MLRFKDFIQLDEVELLDNIKKGRVFHKGVLGRHVPKEAKKIGETEDGHHVHQLSSGPEHQYYVSDPKTKRTNLHLTTRQDGKSEKIGELQGNKQSKGAHKLYHHLVVHHDKILTSDQQSSGGKHVWEKASKHPNIHVHGLTREYNPRKKQYQDKAVHVDIGDDEAHSNYDIASKHLHDAPKDASKKEQEKYKHEYEHEYKKSGITLVMHRKNK